MSLIIMIACGCKWANKEHNIYNTSKDTQTSPTKHTLHISRTPRSSDVETEMANHVTPGTMSVAIQTEG